MPTNSITSILSDDRNELTILVQGRFDFGAHQDFREAYEKPHKAKGPHTVGTQTDLGHLPTHYSVDLKGTTYIDSSALGMLLLMRDHAGGDKAKHKIRLFNCSPDVKKILAISNFAQLFDIA